MKLTLATVALAAALAVPAVSFAQQPAGLSRAEVRAQLIELEQAGYRPGSEGPTYPDRLQAAEARVAARHSISAQASNLDTPAGATRAD